MLYKSWILPWLVFLHWQQSEIDPQWILSRNKVFRTNGTVFDFGAASYNLGRLGYYFSLVIYYYYYYYWS
jgi:hypothetical protein